MSLAKNTLWMTGAAVGQKLVSLVYFTILARVLSVDDLGRYGLALSFTTIFVVLVDFGLTSVLIREGAKFPARLGELTNAVLRLKFYLGVATYLLTIFLAHAFGYEFEVQILIAISGITMLFDSWQLTLYGALRAKGSLRYESFGLFFSQLTTLVLGTISVLAHLPIIFLMLVYLGPSILNTAFARWRLYLAGVKLVGGSDCALIKTLGRAAIPFALAAIFSRLYGNTDTLIIKHFLGNAAVGAYQIPFKIVVAFQFIPLALIAGLYPALSQTIHTNLSEAKRLLFQSFRYLFLVSVPAAVGIFLFANQIVPAVFGALYVQSVPALKAAIIGLPFGFLTFPLGAWLNGSGQQSTQTFIVAIIMIANVAVDWLAAPRYGIVGVAYSGSVSQIILFVISFIIVARQAKFDYRLFLWPKS